MREIWASVIFCANARTLYQNETIPWLTVFKWRSCVLRGTCIVQNTECELPRDRVHPPSCACAAFQTPLALNDQSTCFEGLDLGCRDILDRRLSSLCGIFALNTSSVMQAREGQSLAATSALGEEAEALMTY